MRYLFNKVEDVHPFADNIKPATRYLAWAFKKDPLQTIEVLVTRGWVFLRAFWNVTRKTVTLAFQGSREQRPPGQSGHVPLPPRVTYKIAALAQQCVDASWREWVISAIQGLLSLLMTLITVIFVILAGLTLTGGLGGMTVVYLGAAGLAYFLRRGLQRGFAYLFESNYLLRVARELEQILKPAHEVRYIVLGHNHRATVERLDQIAQPQYQHQEAQSGHPLLGGGKGRALNLPQPRLPQTGPDPHRCWFAAVGLGRSRQNADRRGSIPGQGLATPRQGQNPLPVLRAVDAPAPRRCCHR